VRVTAARVRAVALHDVEPATYQQALHIRDWLAARGVERVTLLVIPAAGMKPLASRSPLAGWLRERVADGDVVAQHGLTHRARMSPGLPRRCVAHFQGGPAAEFPGLDDVGTRTALTLGRSILEDAGLPAAGFVAPAYAYTPSLRRALADEYAWWASLLGVHSPARSRLAPACCLGSSGTVRSVLSPAVAGLLARAPGGLLRIDAHPADFQRAGHLRALERLLERSAGCEAVAYDEGLAA
jgi:predicted deacetylase